jgi:AcrR family transcriptional regulator
MEMQPRGRKKELRGNVRQRELTSSLVALLDEGKRFNDIGIEDITRRAGITRAAFYYFFESKEQVLLGAMTEWNAQIREAARAFLDGGPDDPRRQIVSAISAVVRVRRKHVALVRAFSEAAATHKEVWAVLDGFFEEMAGLVAVRIRDVRAERNRPLSERSAMNMGRALVWMNERNFYRVSSTSATKADWDDILETLSTIWVASIVGEGEEPKRARRR